MLAVVSSLLLASGLLSTCQGQLTALGAPGPTGPSSVPQAGHCTMPERRRAFDRCIQNFGFQHMNHFDFLANNAPNCRAEVFRCPEMNELMQCLNSQPTTVISNQCWIMMPEVLTDTLKDYSIPCTYDDLWNQCKNQRITALKSVSERSNRGRGARNSVFQAVYRRIAPMISMMMYAGMSGGGFGGMFGF